MSINLNSANAAANWLHEQKRDTYSKISQNYHRTFEEWCWNSDPKIVEKGSHLNRLSGFPQGLKCAVFSIAARIVGIVEPFIKGFANIFGAPFSDKCFFKRGVKQLAIDFPLNILKFVFVMPLEVVADLAVSPFAVMFDKAYAGARACFEQEMIERFHPIEFV